MLQNVMHWNVFNFFMLSDAVHGVAKNIHDFVYQIIFSFNPVQSVIPNSFH